MTKKVGVLEPRLFLLKHVHAPIRLMPALPPFLVFDLDDTLLDCSAGGRRFLLEFFLEYAPRFGAPEKQLSTAHLYRC